MNLSSFDTWGYRGLTVAGLVFLVAGAANATGGFPIRDIPTEPTVLAVAAGISLASLFAVLRRRRA